MHLSGQMSIGICVALAASTAIAGPSMSNLEDLQNEALNLEHSWSARLHIDEGPSQPLVVRIPVGDETWTLDLHPHSNRSANYTLYMANADGSLYETEPGPIRTLRGDVVERPGSLVAGSLMEDGLYVNIRLEDGRILWMEPIARHGIGRPGIHALYWNEDIIPNGGTCVTIDNRDVTDVLRWLEGAAVESLRGSCATYEAQLACDTDYEYYQDWGSQTESRINQVINVVNNQYEDDVDITHVITTIIVRSSSSDPYTSNNPETLLGQFRSEWQSNQGGVQRDIAELFTGRELSGSTIGIAYLGSICSTTWGYSLVQSDCCGSLGCAADLSAHEIGHSWNADHCNCSSYTMNSGLTCANQFHPSSTIPAMESYRNSLPCLSCYADEPTGACCIGTSGTCVEITEANCDSGGGNYLGDGVSCSSGGCEPSGACCVGDNCIDTTEAACSAGGGSWNGANSDCADITCGVIGACCVGISCSESTQSDCSGTWYGEATTCGDIECTAPAGDLNATLVTWSRSDGTSMASYDVFYPSGGAQSGLVSVFGEGVDILIMRAWSDGSFDGSADPVAFHHSIYGDDLPHDRALDDILGDDLRYDSYITVGSDDAAIGVPYTVGFDSVGFNSASGIDMDNGAWFVLPDSPMATIGAGTSLGHRIGSFSVEAGQGVEMIVNVQYFDAPGNIVYNRGLYWNNQDLLPGGCTGDIDNDSQVNVSDLLAVIAAWGPCSGSCPEDVDGDGSVNVSDLLAVIGSWGPCP